MEEIFNKNKGLIIGLIILALFVLAVYFLNGDKTNNNHRNNNYNYLKNYKINEVIPIYVTDEDIAKKYLSEYVSLLIYHRKEAFKLVDATVLVEKFDNYEAFDKYVKNLMTDSFIRCTVKKYSYDITDGVKAMHVVDADGNVFIFKETSLMNYTVEL